jgi:hypothetical protein
MIEIEEEPSSLRTREFTPKDLNERLTCSCEQLKMPNRPLLVGILPLTRGELRLEKSS